MSIYLIICICFTGFQKRVLHLLTEIRDGLQQVGKKFEPAESDFHLEQLKTMDEFQEMDLRDVEKKKIVVIKIDYKNMWEKTCIGND